MVHLWGRIQTWVLQNMKKCQLLHHNIDTQIVRQSWFQLMYCNYYNTWIFNVINKLYIPHYSLIFTSNLVCISRDIKDIVSNLLISITSMGLICMKNRLWLKFDSHQIIPIIHMHYNQTCVCLSYSVSACYGKKNGKNSTGKLMSNPLRFPPHYKIKKIWYFLYVAL
jgi:hypothetical protein